MKSDNGSLIRSAKSRRRCWCCCYCSTTLFFLLLSYILVSRIVTAFTPTTIHQQKSYRNHNRHNHDNINLHASTTFLSFSFTSRKITRVETKTTTTQLRATTRRNPFIFQGYEVYAEVSDNTNNKDNKKGDNNKPAVLLIHGFGASSYYWRETRRELESAGYEVHAIDLLGQGQSAKPKNAPSNFYTIDLWAAMVNSYAQEYLSSSRVVLVGNSLGSVVCLSAATGDFAARNSGTPDDTTSLSSSSSHFLKDKIAGIALFNCGVGMNSRNLLKVSSYTRLQVILFSIIFDLFDILIFKNTFLLQFILQNVVSTDLLRNALLSLYDTKAAARVDDDLVNSFYGPVSKPEDLPGAVEALSQIYTNDAGPTPMELHGRYGSLLGGENEKGTLPIHVIWGDKDSVTPLDGPVGQFYQQLAANSNTKTKVSFEIVQNAGHILFDEFPECNVGLRQWLNDAC